MKKSAFLSILFALLFCGFAGNAKGQLASPCAFRYGINEEDSVHCIQNLKKFKQAYWNAYGENPDYEAYAAWQEAINQCPCSWIGLYDPNKTRRMFNCLIIAERDSSRRERMIDSLLWVPMALHTYFPNRISYGYALALKCDFIDDYYFGYHARRPHTVDFRNQMFQDTRLAIELEKEKSMDLIFPVFMKMAIAKTLDTQDTSYFMEAESLVNSLADPLLASYMEYLDNLFVQVDSILKENQLIKERNDSLQKKWKTYTDSINRIHPDWIFSEISPYISDDTNRLYDQMEIAWDIILRLERYGSFKYKRETLNLNNPLDYYIEEIERLQKFNQLFLHTARESCNHYNEILHDAVRTIQYQYWWTSETDFDRWWTEFFCPLWKDTHSGQPYSDIQEKKNFIKESRDFGI